jgi:hypothetical protein
LLPRYCGLLRAIAARNIAWYSELRLQSSDRYLVAVAAMGRYRYYGRYHRYLLPFYMPQRKTCWVCLVTWLTSSLARNEAWVAQAWFQQANV